VCPLSSSGSRMPISLSGSGSAIGPPLVSIRCRAGIHRFSAISSQPAHQARTAWFRRGCRRRPGRRSRPSRRPTEAAAAHADFGGDRLGRVWNPIFVRWPSRVSSNRRRWRSEAAATFGHAALGPSWRDDGPGAGRGARRRRRRESSMGVAMELDHWRRRAHLLRVCGVVVWSRTT
jgi:hypothetical protein